MRKCSVYNKRKTYRLFLKASYLEYTIVPTPTSQHKCFPWKTTDIIFSAFMRKLNEKIYWWNPKLYSQGVFSFEQECCWGSSLLHHSVHITSKPYMKLLPELNTRKTVSPEQLVSSFFMVSENYVTSRVFSLYFGQQKGQMQIWIITNH